MIYDDLQGRKLTVERQGPRGHLSLMSGINDGITGEGEAENLRIITLPDAAMLCLAYEILDELGHTLPDTRRAVSSTRPLYVELATLVEARLNCAGTGAESAGIERPEWFEKHTARILELVANLMPSGAGIGAGTKIALTASTAQKLVFTFGYHHMNDAGMYWTQHKLVVRPSLTSGFDMHISGPDRNGIKDYLYDTYRQALETEVEQYTGVPIPTALQETPTERGVYLRLFNGRESPFESIEDLDEDGPIFGPFAYVDAEGDYLQWKWAGSTLGESTFTVFDVFEGLVYYHGHYYANWRVMSADMFALGLCEHHKMYAVALNVTDFDAARAEMPFLACAECATHYGQAKMPFHYVSEEEAGPDGTSGNVCNGCYHSLYGPMF